MQLTEKFTGAAAFSYELKAGVKNIGEDIFIYSEMVKCFIERGPMA